MTQPTREQDAANGTVSAANTPDPEAAHTPDPEDENYTGESSGLSMEDNGRGLRVAGHAGEGAGNIAQAPSVLGAESPAFEPTSDEDAPNVGHGDEATNTPIFDATPGSEAASQE